MEEKRILYWVPIFHLDTGFVRLDSEILTKIEERIGKVNSDWLWREHQNFWELVRNAVKNYLSDFRNVVIYCEAFPAGERKKVQEFFNLLIKDNPDHLYFSFIRELLSEGAVLEGLEDINLVTTMSRFYHSDQIQAIVDSKKIFNDPEILDLLKKRDAFMAQRINETLPIGGRGIIFIGREHRVIEELDKLEEAGKLTSPMKVIYL